jgi:hypothetical protein
VTNLFGVAWGVAGLVVLWQYPTFSRTLALASLAYPVYYFVLSFAAQARAPVPSR